MRLYDPSQHQTQTLCYGQDLGIACRLLAHQVLWILGYPDQALMSAQEALEIAKRFHHLNSLAYGLACLPHVHYERGEWNAAQRRAEDVVTFATDGTAAILYRSDVYHLGCSAGCAEALRKRHKQNAPAGLTPSVPRAGWGSSSYFWHYT